MVDCLFCKIAKKEIPVEVICENEEALSFLDVNPFVLGHALIIPKSHAENIGDLRDEEVGPVFQTVKKVTGMLKKALGPEGFTIGINHGRISGQSVPHLHIHVIPRYPGDGGGSIHSVVENRPKESVKETREKIIKANYGN
ncbi:MAG: HIT family protein [Candidatus Colwellbacteria bacterium]